MTANCYCLYLDVLGFKERTTAASRAGRLVELMSPLEVAIANAVSRFQDRAEWTAESMWHWRLFSDNVLLWRIILSDEAEYEMGEIFREASWLQLDLAAAGFFTRGGLAQGELFWTNHLVTGAPLFEAVALEEAAVFPRVQLSEAMLVTATDHVALYSEQEGAPQTQNLWRAPDGTIFLNFLSLLEDDWITSSHALELLTQFRTHLADQIQHSRGHVRNKLLWLASYHDAWAIQRSNGHEPLIGQPGDATFGPWLPN